MADCVETYLGQYQELEPLLELGLPFLPLRFEAGYSRWPLLPELLPVSFPGVKTSRDQLLVDVDRGRLVERMRCYFDPAVSHEDMRRIAPAAMESTARFEAVAVRERLLRRGFLPGNVVRYCYRPFDVRWLYWEPETKLLDEKRREYFLQVQARNAWLSAGQRNRMETFYQPQFAGVLADHHIVESNVSMFPLRVYSAADEMQMLGGGENGRANLTSTALGYLAGTGLPEGDLFYHVLAVLHAPEYHCQNIGALRQDWPRVPLPSAGGALLASAELGRQVTALLDPETPVPGVTTDVTRPALRVVALAARAGGGSLDPARDLEVTAGWGHAGQGGVAMPGQGRAVRREYEAGELAALEAEASALGMAREEVLGLLGETTLDIYLNQVALWCNVPARVWSYTLGGYQVLKKWLSYRDRHLLGRALHKEEVREFTSIARRIAALLLLGPQLDANYRAAKETALPWPPGAT